MKRLFLFGLVAALLLAFVLVITHAPTHAPESPGEVGDIEHVESDEDGRLGEASLPEASQPEPEPEASVDELAHLAVALGEVGVREIGNNRGERVELYQASASIPPGSPWCAAFVGYCIQEAERIEGTEVISPGSRGGVATSYIVSSGRLTGARSIDARDVQFGRAEVNPGDLAVWRLGGSWRGHIGVVNDWSGTCGSVVEGNTSGAARATTDQVRDGDGVYLTRRCVGQGGSLRIVAFTPVIYAA